MKLKLFRYHQCGQCLCITALKIQHPQDPQDPQDRQDLLDYQDQQDIWDTRRLYCLVVIWAIIAWVRQILFS